MPFTLFKFPTLFGKKQSSYKLRQSELVPMKFDLDTEIDPVIVTQSKPSFTTFGYNSEYALEDILKSGIYNEDDEQVIDHAEELFQRKAARRQRPKNPFQNSLEEVDKNDNEHDLLENEDEMLNKDEDNDSINEEEFQELYDNMQKYNSEYFDGNIEEIYENLVGLAHEEATNTSGSFLPPEIYALHMESHQQRMGILSRYVETANYSLGEDADGADLWSNTNFKWKNKDIEENNVNWMEFEFLEPSPRIDFIPSRETTVQDNFYIKSDDANNDDGDEESFYKVPRPLNITPIQVETTTQTPSENMDEMNGSDSDCESLDSGLETGNSNLETSENGFVTIEGDTDTVSDDENDKLEREESNLSDFSEGIYENAAVLKSSTMSSSSDTTILEKYEFGQETNDHDVDDDDADVDEGKQSDSEPVSFQDIESFETSPPVMTQSVKKSWGVRRESLTQNTVERTVNPTEEKIAKEIRELKEREEELIKLREQSVSNDISDDKNDVNEDENDNNSDKDDKDPEDSVIEEKGSVKFTDVKPIFQSSKFNPSLYGPCILPPRSKAGIMQTFINNKGKVNAFKTTSDNVVTLRKPQVYKSVPKVSPPVGSVGNRQTGNVLDKIQAELAETKRREDELRRQRRDVMQEVKNDDVNDATENGNDDCGDEYYEEEDEETSSLVTTRGKSGLISVWENRIQCEKAA